MWGVVKVVGPGLELTVHCCCKAFGEEAEEKIEHKHELQRSSHAAFDLHLELILKITIVKALHRLTSISPQL